MKTWVLVADASRARILQAHNRTGPLEDLEDLVDPAARMQSRDLASDAPGRGHDATGRGRHAFDPSSDIKRNEATRFARLICETLQRAHEQKRFERLYVAAPPAFLGLLREQLDPGVRATVSAEINKDFSRQTTKEIRAHLPELL